MIKNIFSSNARSQTFWAILAKGISATGGLFIVILVPNLFGIEAYGSLVLLLSYITILGMFLVTPIEHAVRRDISKNQDNEISLIYFKEGVKLKLLFATIVSAFFLLFTSTSNITIIKENILLIVVLFIVINMWGIVARSLEAWHKIKHVFGMYLIEYSLKISSIFALVFFGFQDVKSLLIVFIISYIFALVYGASIVFRKLSFISSSIEVSFNSIRKTIIKRSFLLMLTGLSGVLLAKIDLLMISYYLTIEDVGLYSIASDIVKHLTIFSMPFILAVIPLFAQAENTKLLKKYTKNLAFLNIGIFICVAMFSVPFVSVVYGSEMLIIAYLMMSLAIYPLLFIFQYFAQEVLIMRDKITNVFFAGLIAIFINISLNVLLINEYGLYGVVFATLVAQLVWGVLNYYVIFLNGKDY